MIKRKITEKTFSGNHPNAEHIVGVLYNPREKSVKVSTPNGEKTGRIGDWIVQEDDGTFKIEKGKNEN